MEEELLMSHHSPIIFPVDNFDTQLLLNWIEKDQELN